MASEAGNAAAEAAIQAHGGYGYTREYLVEKIKRDVRITTIYEGTSEIMEMTIARDRWQEHLKTRGGYYHDRAAALEALDPAVGAGTAALALHALAEVFEWCRTGRLTRQQHVLLRLGELAAFAECAEALCRRAARAAEGTLGPKADRRFDAGGLATLARVFARDAARRVAGGGLQLVHGAGGAADGRLPELEAALRIHEIAAAEAGGIDDMDAAADAIYGRGPEQRGS
jgi:alkylation response protein AidB-like acyl-CoA dehydrogenase